MCKICPGWLEYEGRCKYGVVEEVLVAEELSVDEMKMSSWLRAKAALVRPVPLAPWCWTMVRP